MIQSCTIRRAAALPALEAPFDAPEWAAAETLLVDKFHPLGSGHRPEVRVKLLHDTTAVQGVFHVRDRHVIARQTGYQAMVCKDSCVEFFVRPKPDKGYMNFEMNACGVLLSEYVEDPTRTNAGFKKFEWTAERFGGMVRIHSTLKGPVMEEIAGPVEYTVGFRIPFGVLEAYVGALGAVGGQIWRANCYKCADESSHPHWAAWSPVGENLNFHQPERFGIMRLE